MALAAFSASVFCGAGSSVTADGASAGGSTAVVASALGVVAAAEPAAEGEPACAVWDLASTGAGRSWAVPGALAFWLWSSDTALDDGAGTGLAGATSAGAAATLAAAAARSALIFSIQSPEPGTRSDEAAEAADPDGSLATVVIHSPTLAAICDPPAAGPGIETN